MDLKLSVREAWIITKLLQEGLSTNPNLTELKTIQDRILDKGEFD